MLDGEHAMPTNGPPNRPIESEDVPPMDRAEFRLPVDLKGRVQAEAERQGLDFSEYTRRALERELAWKDALEAVRAGGEPDALADTERLLRHLRLLAD